MILLKMYPGCYDFCGGGHVNYGEDCLDAIIRETKEELNYLYYYTPDEILKMIKDTPQLFKIDYRKIFKKIFEDKESNKHEI